MIDFEIALIQIRAKEPSILFDNVDKDFYGRLNELSKEELEELKRIFINNEWFEYVRAIQNEIDRK